MKPACAERTLRASLGLRGDLQRTTVRTSICVLFCRSLRLNLWPFHRFTGQPRRRGAVCGSLNYSSDVSVSDAFCRRYAKNTYIIYLHMYRDIAGYFLRRASVLAHTDDEEKKFKLVFSMCLRIASTTYKKVHDSGKFNHNCGILWMILSCWFIFNKFAINARNVHFFHIETKASYASNRKEIVHLRNKINNNNNADINKYQYSEKISCSLKYTSYRECNHDVTITKQHEFDTSPSFVTHDCNTSLVAYNSRLTRFSHD